VTPARALLLENIHSDAAWNLKDAGWDVERLDRALGEDELVERLAGVQLLGCAPARR
jgi:D-3-phosphoglycerate dehydrogenase